MKVLKGVYIDDRGELKMCKKEEVLEKACKNVGNIKESKGD